ncbi:head GIN domain-containing protein [Maricaulis sp.]|uniref:head GIN domain-containing protein n=1 Tax=Maricaulis sp. TaxID=1486257 RepID=UPI002B2794DF|nr:head GIN domain-containing protein [Maricaulis sp.]
MRFERLTILASTALAALALTAPGFAQDSEIRDLTGFTAIDANGGYELVVVQGDTFSVELVGDADDFDDIETEVNRGTLAIDQDTGWFSRRHSLDVVVQVTLPAIEELDFGRGLRAEVSDIDSDQLEVEVSTGTSVRLSGRCGSLEIDASTGTSLNGRNLVCARVDVDASTGASVSAHATEASDSSASMGASIRIHGNPPSRDARSSMGGSVSHPAGG